MNGQKNVYYSWYTLQPLNICMTYQRILGTIQGIHTSLPNITIDHWLLLNCRRNWLSPNRNNALEIHKNFWSAILRGITLWVNTIPIFVDGGIMVDATLRRSKIVTCALYCVKNKDKFIIPLLGRECPFPPSQVSLWYSWTLLSLGPAPN